MVPTQSWFLNLNIMRPHLTDSHRQLLYVLFWLFEFLLIASALVLVLTDPRQNPPASEVAGLTFWFAFVGLFTVSFILRRAARRFAVIGWVSLFVGFWGLAAIPIL